MRTTASFIGRSSLGLLLLLALIAPALAQGVDGQSDFFQIARRGFVETIDNNGNFVIQANGSQRNNYSWSGAWFGNKLLIGTVRDIICVLVGGGDPSCPTDGQLTPDQRGEIWAYTPNPLTVGGIHGTWQRVFQSPLVPILNQPRDVGYRNMTTCDAGGTNRLYVTAMGLGGHILHTTNGTTFDLASDGNLNNSLINVANGTSDLGYRALVCWQGRLWTAPSGNNANGGFDADVPFRPILLSHANPTNTGQNWTIQLNLQTHPTLGDPGNLGIFDAEVFNGDLYIGVSNRTTGFEVWKASAASCALPPGACNLVWTRIIDNGAGTTFDGGGRPRNAGTSDLVVFGGALYVGVSDAAAVNQEPAEIVRINADGTYDLIVGSARVKATMMATAPNFNCTVVGDPDSGGPLTAADGCLPLSGKGRGFGGGAPNFSNGQASYFWRGTVFGGFLYFGTLDLSSSSPGFDIVRTSDGTNWTFVNRNGLGNTANYGVRTLLSIPDWPDGPAMILGSANASTSAATPPNTGGLEVFVATCSTSGPPLVVTGPALPDPSFQGLFGSLNVVFDNYTALGPIDVNPAVGVVTMSAPVAPLNSSGSGDRFCGSLHPTTPFAWFMGNFAGPGQTCNFGGPEPGAPTLLGTGATQAVTLATGPDYTDYVITLRVRDADNNDSCGVYNVRASLNKPPTAAITAPIAIGSMSSGTHTIVDTDNTPKDVNLAGTCTDPEVQPLALCQWIISGGTATIADPNVPNTTVTVSQPGVALIFATQDNLGYVGFAQLNIAVVPAVHDGKVVSITPTTLPATENAEQNVTVNVKNEGNVTDTFSVSLADETGGTMSPSPQSTGPLGPGASTNLIFTWTPTKGSNHTLKATVTALAGETDTADNTLEVLAAVTDVNDPPQAVNDAAGTTTGTPVAISVLTNDTDEEGGLFVDSFTQGAHGTVNCTASTCTYTPAAGFTGQDSFTYTLEDAGGAQSVGTVTVTVVAPGSTPGKPTNVVLSIVSGRNLHASWTDNAFNETRYHVQRCKKNGNKCPWSNISTSLPANTDDLDTTVGSAGRWKVRVRACRNSNCSAWAPSTFLQVP